MKHGIEYECKALEQYQNYLKHSGHPVKTFSSGFVVNPAYTFLGCSPDAKVIDETEENAYGIVEIKCPYKHRNVTPETACAGDSQFHLKMKDDFPVLKTNHKYYYQVQGQMGITGAKWCDFVTYTFFTTMLLKLEQFFLSPLPNFSKHFGDAVDHVKIEGTASSIKYRRPVKLLRKSVGLKCNEQILVRSVI